MRVARVVVASDKFKGSLSGAGVADALTRGLRSVDPHVEVAVIPVADGGDGTVEAFAHAGATRHELEVTGPTGRPARGTWARLGDVGIVELAAVSGLALLPDGADGGLRPLAAGTLGTGQALAAALDAGCREIVLGLGGSASTDGGAGLLVGLGARLASYDGTPVAAGGAGLADLAAVDLGPALDRLRGVSLTVASDVDNPLLGRHGAAAVYGPQKGASPSQVRLLDAALARFADLVEAALGHSVRYQPGAGAAGGAGFAALALGGRLRPGIEVVLELLDADRMLAGADLVITGEGSLDEQSLHGKAPTGVVRAAARAGVPVVAVCGRSTLTDEQLVEAGFGATWRLTDLEPDPTRCMADAATLLERVGALVGERLAVGGPARRG